MDKDDLYLKLRANTLIDPYFLFQIGYFSEAETKSLFPIRSITIYFSQSDKEAT